MLAACTEEKLLRERIISHYVRPVADDLRMLDLQGFAKQISCDRVSNVDSLVGASCELYFKTGTLRFSRVADVELAWRSCPRVSLVLTFHADNLTASFLLLMDADFASVELEFMSHPQDISASEATRLLEARLHESRKFHLGRGPGIEPHRLVTSPLVSRVEISSASQ